MSGIGVPAVVVAKKTIATTSLYNLIPFASALSPVGLTILVGVGIGTCLFWHLYSSSNSRATSKDKQVSAAVAPVRSKAIVKTSSSASKSGTDTNNNAANSGTNGNATNSSSSSANGSTSGKSNQSGTGNVVEDGAGGGDDGDKDRKANGKKNQHETDGESKIEEKDKQNEPPEQGDRVKRRKVTTALIEIPLYPAAPVKPLRDPSEESFFIRLTFDKNVRLQSPGENGFYPRQHLLCRCIMLFYGYGRLLELCEEIGVDVKDICIFGNSVYKDLRATKVEKLELIHAAHIFPITDFDFETIRRRLG